MLCIELFQGPISLVKISNDQQTIAYANAYGEIALYCFKNVISKSSKVSLTGGVCTALFWHYSDKELYVGDSNGSVSVISLSFFIGRNLFNLQLSPILLLDSKIIQIDGFNDYILVSSITKTILCNNDREEFKQIGNRPRDGDFGACFSIDFESLETQQSKILAIDEFGYDRLLMENVKIFCSRPGMRLWQVDLNGNVLKTHQYKNSSYQSEKVTLVESRNPAELLDKVNQFQTITSLCNTFLFTWNSCGFFIIEPKNSKIIFWTNEFEDNKIIWTKIVNNSIFIHLKDGRLLELKFYKLQHYLLELCHKESFSEAVCILIQNFDYFLNFLEHTSDLTSYKILLRIREYLKTNEADEMLKTLADIFDVISGQRIQNVKILAKEKSPEKEEVVTKYVSSQEDDNTKEIQRAVHQLYILHQTSLISNFNFRERLCKIFDQFKSSSIIEILNQLESVFVENEDYEKEGSIKVVSRMFLDYLQPEIIFEIEEESTLNFIARALIVVQTEELEVERCRECSFPLNCGVNSSGYEQIGNILQQFYWSRGEHDKCFELCRSLPYLLKITGKFMTDEKKFEKIITYAVNLGNLEILHKSLELFNDISLFDQLLEDYISALEGKYKCLNCDEMNEITEGQRILSWDSLFQAIEYYLCGEELIDLLMRYSRFIPNGSLSRQFYMKLLLNAA